MKINFNKPKNQYIEYLKYIGVGILAIIFQLFIVRYFEIYNIAPDLLLIIGVLVAIKEGRFIGLLYVFVMGLLLDIFANDYYGLSSLSKLFAILFAGSFFEEDKSILILSKFKFLLITLGASIINNLFFYLFDIRDTNFDFTTYLMYFVIANATYTSAIASFVLVYYSNKRY